MHHEIGIAEDLLKRILEEAQKKRIEKVCKAKVKIGEFYLAHPDQLKYSFEMVSKGTLAEGAKLKVKTTPLKARCSSCLKDFDSPALSCPSCGSKSIEITSGQELLVENIE